MKVAIHHRKGSFSERWISYCKENNIDFEIVNAFDADFLHRMNNFDVFMWHHHQSLYEDTLLAKTLLFALEHAGVKVFPDFKTGWYFDDKVAETYLLEALDLPVVPSKIFYDKASALKWLDSTDFPKVFKLKNGASGANVRIVKSRKEAIKYVQRSFGRGYPQYDGIERFKESLRIYFRKESSLLRPIKSLIRVFVPTKFSRWSAKERGYCYFQDFIPNNGFDTRVIVIGDKAFAMKNLIRANDFRASNSGDFLFERADINEECIKLAFEAQKRMGSQSMGFDIIESKDGQLFILEMGYGFIADIYRSCPGYWDRNMNWHEKTFYPQDWMIEQVLNG